ncbi:MAG: protein kinase domain-containing protein [Gemmatimonadaceae bacterium]
MEPTPSPGGPTPASDRSAAETRAEEWRYANRLFAAGLELPRDARDAMFARECANNEQLKERVLALVAAHDALGADATGSRDFLGRLDVERAVGLLNTGRAVGPYRIVRELGRGGMGAVYLAERTDGQFEQLVALKVIKRGMDTEEIHRRFRAERQILARLNHPHIARLLDGGLTEQGQPWFAMEYVQGEPITTHCDTQRLGLAERLRIFRQVCDAVRFAHATLVVHRDLKPSNVLVVPDVGPGVGTAKLLDFGIAKVLRAPSDGEDGARAPPHPTTQLDARLLTPDYAAPEQVRGEPVTTATDVYALGALLYELLTGRRAHRFARYTAAEMERVVCEVEPEPPSAAVLRPADPHDAGAPGDTADAPSSARGATPERLRRALAGDLDTIVLASLHKDPRRRYATVDALLDDLDRFAAGLPVRVRPDSVGYRVKKFVLRHRIGVAAAVAVSLSVVGGATAAIWQARAAAREASRATSEATRAIAAKNFLSGIFTEADPGRALGDTLTAHDLLDRARVRLDRDFASQPDVRLDLLLTLGVIYRRNQRLPVADSLARAALALAESTYGPASVAAANALQTLGATRLVAGELQSADSLATLAVAILRQQRGADSVLAGSLDVRGSIKNRLGHFAAAESSYREAIALAARARLDSAQLGSFWQNLNVTLGDAGRREAADTALRQALAIQQRVLPPEHPSLLLSLGSLASRLQTRWEMDSAIALAEDVLRRQQRVYPRGHERVATAMNNLAFYRMQRGDHSSAQAGFRDAHEMILRLHGPKHLTTLILLNNVGRALVLGGKPAEAEGIFPRVLAGLRSVAPNHPYTGQALLWLGRALEAQGRLAAARNALDSALVLSRSLPPEHPRTAEVRVALGAVDLRDKRFADAESHLRWALAWRTRHLEPRDPLIAEATLLLARGRAEQGARSDAESLYTAGIRRLESNRYRAGHAAAARSELAMWQARWR